MTQWLSAFYIFRITSYGNKTISSNRPSCWIQISMVGVINSCLTTIKHLWHSLYDTHRRTKLTALEMISRSRDMVGDHQNLNSRDLTTPLSGRFAIRGLALAALNLPTKFEVYLHSLWRYERQYKMGWFGIVRVTQGHRK